MERRLASRPPPMPSAGHRERVLAAVARELAARRAPWWRRPAVWQMAAAAAAVLVLWANLAVTTAGRPLALGTEDGNGRALASAAAQIRAVVPGLSEREARRQALLLRTGVAWTPLRRSVLGVGDTRWPAYDKEVGAWDSP